MYMDVERILDARQMAVASELICARCPPLHVSKLLAEVRPYSGLVKLDVHRCGKRSWCKTDGSSLRIDLCPPYMFLSFSQKSSQTMEWAHIPTSLWAAQTDGSGLKRTEQAQHFGGQAQSFCQSYNRPGGPKRYPSSNSEVWVYAIGVCAYVQW